MGISDVIGIFSFTRPTSFLAVITFKHVLIVFFLAVAFSLPFFTEVMGVSACLG